MGSSELENRIKPPSPKEKGEEEKKGLGKRNFFSKKIN